MKVENAQTNRLVQKQAEEAAPLERNKRPIDNEKAETLGGKDQASFSERARLLAKVKTSFDETPDVRTERVNSLKEQITTGSYKIPMDELAKRLASRFKID